jgi:hypothetical protein
MLRKLLLKLVDRLPPPRVIYGRDGHTPYLSRFYLFGRPRMPDGSSPFDGHGNLRKGSIASKKLFGINIMIHYFHRSDDDGELHSHPWRWALSYILQGEYSEERRTKDDLVERRLYGPGDFNLITKDTFHRVDLVPTMEESGVWTLFITGPRFTSWGFWDRHTGVYTPWREFLGVQ